MIRKVPAQLLAFVLIFSQTMASAFAGEICYGPDGTLPIGADGLSLLGTSPEEMSQGNPSDREIITAHDAKYCSNGAKKNNFQYYDPHSLPDDGSVWRSGSKRWSVEEEAKFAKWVETEVDDDFLIRYKLPADCADAAMTIRAVYSRIHHLPATFSWGTGKRSSDEKTYAKYSTVRNWDESNWKKAVLEDKRFRAWLDQVRKDLGTVNLPATTYPIKISSCTRPGKLSEEVKAGVVLLSGGHTRFISTLDTLNYYTPIKQRASTSGIIERTIPETNIYFDMNEEVGRGVLRFNWAVNCGNGFDVVRDDKMPGYSLEQYQPEIAKKNLGETLVAMTPGERRSPNKGVIEERFREDVRVLIERRIGLVNTALELNKKDPATFSSPKSAVYDEYSTPSMDKSVRDRIFGLRDWVSTKGTRSLSRYIDDSLAAKVIVIGGGRYMTLAEFDEAIHAGKVSSDPGASFEERWGWSYIVCRARDARNSVQGYASILKREADQRSTWDAFFNSKKPLPSQDEYDAAVLSLNRYKKKGVTEAEMDAASCN